jgi:hypothetical protein
MISTEELASLYEQWRHLTEEEGRAIDAADWSRVAVCQSGKSRLQPRIVEVSQRLDATTHEQQFRPIVAQLMEMEHANRDRLQKQRESAEERKQELDRSSRHLRQLHQAYVPPARANWQSYS